MFGGVRFLRLKVWLLGAGVAVLSVLGAFIAGRRQASEAAKVQDLKDDAKRHRDMNDADLGIGASDADNIRWLQSFTERNER